MVTNNSNFGRRVAWLSPLNFLPASAKSEDPKPAVGPVIFRFDNDDFMTEAINLLTGGGAGLAEKVAYAETWKGAIDNAQNAPIKLYLPAHKRFYLVAASLVMKELGFPDNQVDAKKQETARFVFRRIEPANGQQIDINKPNTFKEFAWFADKAAWSLVSDGYNVASDGVSREETFPLHSYRAGGTCGRTFLMGYIPLAAREGAVTPVENDPPQLEISNNNTDQRFIRDQRCILWRIQVVQPLIDLYSQSCADVAALLDTDDKLREALFFLVADIAAFFRKFNVKQDAQDKLFQNLGNPVFNSPKTWKQAVASIDPLYDKNSEGEIIGISNSWYDKIINGTISMDCVANMTSSAIKTAISNLGIGSTADIKSLDIYNKLYDVLPEQDNTTSTSSSTQPSMAMQDTQYILRCVYDHPLCKGPLDKTPLHPPFVSEPTVPFKIAYYFDADAPQRPVKILMPIDTSIAGLKKLPRNVKVMISNQLASQIERIKGIKIKDLEDGTINDDPKLDVGMICSFSIQIVFIIALILLFMFAIILNLVFWWMPFFRICLPIPLIKSKS